MTRETKIGLLVGLAFIIVIGILLSDHMTSTTEPTPASLADAGSDVRKTVTALAPENPPVTTIITPQSPISPRQPVPIQGEAAAPQRQPESIVRVGPGNYVVPPAITIHSPQNPQNTQVAGGSQENSERRAANETSPSGNIIPQQLQEAAREQGEQLVLTGPQASPAAEQHEYVAQAGDSVSRMAARLMGLNNKANREAIVKANPSLQQDPNKVIVGRKYVIPLAGGALIVAARVPAPTPAPAPAPAPTEVDSHVNWYTVKANDSLWRIAEDQLGDAGSIAAIKELNKDVLKGSEGIRPGMRLRLPAKSIASAQ